MAKEPKFPRPKEGDDILRNGPRSHRAKLNSLADAWPDFPKDDYADASDAEYEEALAEYGRSGRVHTVAPTARIAAPDSND